MSIYSHTSQESLNKSDLQRAIKGFFFSLFFLFLLFFISSFWFLQKTISHSCYSIASSGILLDNEIIDLLFFIFDSNGDGQLDASEFVDVLKAK